MGTFLSCGIAKTIAVEKERYKKEEVLEELGKTIDLNIYMEPLENEDYLLLEMKMDYLEKYAVKFVEEQLKIALRNANQEQKYKNTISQLKGKEYDELMEIAKSCQYENFQLIKGNIYSNNISYITNKFRIHADLIVYITDGKVLMECYADTFAYFRKLIIKNSTNPIKTSVMVSIIG